MFESYILAGGRSSRMKRDKAFLQLGGKTLLERIIATLQNIKSKKISVVAAEKDSEKFANVSDEIFVVADIYENRGTLGGIHAALSACKADFALISAGDYPFVSEDLFGFLLEIAEKKEAGCVAPVQKDGIIQPLCGVYQPSKCLEILTAILEVPGQTPSARDFLQLTDTHFVGFEEFAHLPNAENFFFNINTPEDFERAQKLYSFMTN